jgi:hypothetical protein
MEVGVEPERRARPLGRGDRVVPDGADGVRVVDQSSLGGGGESRGELVGVVGQWPAAVAAGGRGPAALIWPR